jgi:hypothetical protein
LINALTAQNVKAAAKSWQNNPALCGAILSGYSLVLTEFWKSCSQQCFGEWWRFRVPASRDLFVFRFLIPQVVLVEAISL